MQRLGSSSDFKTDRGEDNLRISWLLRKIILEKLILTVYPADFSHLIRPRFDRRSAGKINIGFQVRQPVQFGHELILTTISLSIIIFHGLDIT